MTTDLFIKNNNKKIIFLILDKPGNNPNPEHAYQTRLEIDTKPDINMLSLKMGIPGPVLPVDTGITPGSCPGCLFINVDLQDRIQIMPLMPAHAFKLDKYGA